MLDELRIIVSYVADGKIPGTKNSEIFRGFAINFQKREFYFKWRAKMMYSRGLVFTKSRNGIRRLNAASNVRLNKFKKMLNAALVFWIIKINKR